MNQKIFQFCLSALIYWIVATLTFYILEIPEKIYGIAIFIPPVLGLMWGLPAALGIYIGGLFALPEVNNLISAGISDWILYFVRNIWLFLAGFLPYKLWQKILIHSEKPEFSLGVHTLKKFLIIIFVTFVVTSIFRTLTATPAEFRLVANLSEFGKTETFLTYFLACFINDFFIAIFFDLAWFFFLINRNYPFNDSAQVAINENLKNDLNNAWFIALIFYMIFPAAVLYISQFQIYGMNNVETWLNFIAKCLSAIDVYLVLMLYLLLHYRRSIMLEVVFLVTQTVFLSSTVLGWGISAAMGNIVNEHAKESLNAMSVICRERLYRTFFCVRQAVNGMSLQAVDAIESYDRLADDAVYRKNYIDRMKNDLSFIALRTDGCISYYLRFIPEIEGTQGGFSMQREDVRWEGALSPFVERNPIDLALYSPDDIPNVGWYYIPKKAQCATWIEPYVDAVTKFYVISYVAPLFLDGKFIGVVGMDIDFNFIIQELRRMSIYDYGYVYILNRNNTVLYHRYLTQGSQFQPNPEYQEMEVYLSNGMWLGIATPLSKVYEERNIVLMNLIAAIIVVAMIISLGSITLAARAIKPLAGMTEAAKRIASGDLNVKISYESGNELGILVRSIREMAAKLEIYVYRDKLTGLRNTAAYIIKANDLNAQNKIMYDLAYGVVIFDVNFLKKANDNYGHEAGNELLRHAAKVIREVFADSPVYRTGGDEFAAILEGEDYEHREELLKLFDEEVAKEQFTVAGDTLTVSVARGLGIYERGMEFSEVSKKADVAMYNHKAAIKAKYGEEVR